MMDLNLHTNSNETEQAFESLKSWVDFYSKKSWINFVIDEKLDAPAAVPDNSINNDSKYSKDQRIRNVYEAGNPYDYYISIMNYLNNTSINMIILGTNKNINNKLSASSKTINIIFNNYISLNKIDKIPHIKTLKDIF